MKEDFLHFIWQHQYFNKSKLQTAFNENVNVLDPGILNKQSGPDFSDASIKIGSILWKGNVEIHIKASNWNHHNHQRDRAYNNVVLHVVRDHDLDIEREDGTKIPTIEIGNRIDEALVDRWELLAQSISEIPCQAMLKSVNVLHKLNMVEKALIERLRRKGQLVLDILAAKKNDWEATSIVWMIRNFGFKANAKSFEQLSEKVPTQVLRRNTHNLFAVESILFGFAGFLRGRSADEYHRKLKNEYGYIRKKYGLSRESINEVSWKFGNLRPQNFPTARISQLAGALSHLKNVFSELTGLQSYPAIRQKLMAPTSDYWQSHYRFGHAANRKTAILGQSSTDVLIINAVVPLLAAYSMYSDNSEYLDRGIELLQQIKPEDNSKIRRWMALGMEASSSADTQGLIEMIDSYCSQKLCLSCNIGTSIVQPARK